MAGIELTCYSDPLCYHCVTEALNHMTLSPQAMKYYRDPECSGAAVVRSRSVIDVQLAQSQDPWWESQLAG